MSDRGHLHSVNVSQGGVPKLPVDSAMVTKLGVEGDVQKNRKFHGGPERAVCVFSQELIRALQEEGHPIGTGTTGENLTVSGIDWDLVTPGCRIEVGDALLEVTSFTKPCRTIRDSFFEQRFIRISQKTNPGWSRVYARVLREGVVRTGDTVRVTPSDTAAQGWLEALLT